LSVLPVIIGTVVAAAAADDDDDNDDDDYVGVRVKELGPGEIKPSSDPPAAAAAGGIIGSSLLSAQKSDLALLRNANVRPLTSLPTSLAAYSAEWDGEP